MGVFRVLVTGGEVYFTLRMNVRKFKISIVFGFTTRIVFDEEHLYVDRERRGQYHEKWNEEQATGGEKSPKALKNLFHEHLLSTHQIAEDPLSVARFVVQAFLCPSN